MNRILSKRIKTLLHLGLVLALLGPLPTFGQSLAQKADSLVKKELVTKLEMRQFIKRVSQDPEQAFVEPSLKLAWTQRFTHPKASLALLDSCRELLKGEESRCEERLHVELTQAIIRSHQGNHKWAAQQLEKIFADSCATPVQKAKITKELGSVAYYAGKLKEAARHYRAALSQFKNLSDSAEVGQLYLNLGAVYSSRQLKLTAQYYFEQALDYRAYMREANRMLLHNNLAANYLDMSRPAKAAQQLHQAATWAMKPGNLSNTSLLINGNLLRLPDSLIEPYLQKGATKTLESLEGSQLARSLAATGMLLNYHWRRRDSLKYQQIARRILAQPINDTAGFIKHFMPRLRGKAAQGLAQEQMDALTGFAFGKGFSFLSKLISALQSWPSWQVPDSLQALHAYKLEDYLRSRDAQSYQDMMRYASLREKDRQELVTAQLEKQKAQEQKLLSAGIIAVSALLGVSLVLVYNLRRKAQLNRALSQQRQETLDKENQALRSENAHLQSQRQMETFRQELLDSVLPSVEQLYQEARQLFQKANPTQKALLNNLQHQYRRLEKITDIRLESNPELNASEALDSQLSENEKLVAKMIKTGMSSKEIALSLNRQPSYINNIRSIIRKKLQLRKEDSLSEKLQEIVL
jgi:DNA-binding CsgD family transcriptional regulator